MSPFRAENQRALTCTCNARDLGRGVSDDCWNQVPTLNVCTPNDAKVARRFAQRGLLFARLRGSCHSLAHASALDLRRLQCLTALALILSSCAGAIAILFP